MSITFAAILDVMTNQWQSREEIERAVGGSCMSQLVAMQYSGRVLHMVEVQNGHWIHRYCKSHAVGDPLIGTGRVPCPCCGRTAA